MKCIIRLISNNCGWFCCYGIDDNDDNDDDDDDDYNDIEYDVKG